MADENTVVVQVSFAGGVDEKSARQYLDPTTRQAAIVNGEFQKLGAIDQRLGLEHLPNAEVPGSDIPAIQDGVRIASWARSTVTAMGSGGLYSFSDAQQGLVGVSELPDVVSLRTGVVTSPTPLPPILLDVPYNSRTLRVAIYWDADFNIAATVTDLDSGDVVLQPTVVFTNTGGLNVGTIPVPVSSIHLPLAPAAQRAVVTVFNNQNSTLYGINYDPVTNSFTSPVSMGTASGVGTVGVVDVVPFQGYPGGGLVVVRSTSTTAFRIDHYAPDFTTVVATKTVTLTAGQAVNYPVYLVCDYAADNSECCWLFYATLQGSNFRMFYLRMAGDGTFADELGGPVNFIAATTTQWILSGACRFAPRRVLTQVHRSRNPDLQQGAVTVDGFYYTFDGRDPLTSGTLNGFGHTPYGYWPLNRPFSHGGEVFQTYVYDLYLGTSSSSSGPRSTQRTLYLMKYRELDSNVSASCVACLPVSTVAPRIVDQSFGLLIMLFTLFRRPFMSAISSDDGRYACGIRTVGIATSANAGYIGPAWSADYLFDEESRRDLYQPAELAQELAISGSVPFVADGNIAFEESFFNYPEKSYVKLGGSGITITAGQYIYALVYTYFDASGLIHRGAPQFTNAVTVAGNGLTGAIVYITPCSATWRDVANPGTVYCEIYRTLANGSTFYFLDRIEISNTQDMVVQWPLGGGADNQSNVNLATASLLYTTGGAAVDTVNPPCSLLHIGHKNRRAIVDETGQTVYMTTEFDEPGVAPGWNEGISQEFPEGGRITALASMDGKLVVFKYSSIWIMVGDGPLNNGLQSNWSVPESVSTDTGATGWRGVVNTPVGVVFRSPVGIYVLRRNLQVEYVGEAVQDTLADFPNVTSAVLVPDSTQVRFTCTNEAGDDSVVIVFDYQHQFWTTFRYDRLSAPIASAALVGTPPRYGIITEDGELWREKARTSATAHMDQDSSDVEHFVECSVTTAQFKLGLQGYQRFRTVTVMAERMDDCGLMVEVLDAAGTVVQTARWFSDELDQLQSPVQVQVNVGSRWTRSRALQFRVTSLEGASPTTGRGMRLIGAAVVIENIGPVYAKVPALGRR